MLKSAELPIDLSHANCRSLGIDPAFGSLVALVATRWNNSVTMCINLCIYIYQYQFISYIISYQFIQIHISLVVERWQNFHCRDSKNTCEASTAGPDQRSPETWPFTGLEAARRRHQWAVDCQRSTLSAIGKLNHRHVSKPFFETLKQQSFPGSTYTCTRGSW